MEKTLAFVFSLYLISYSSGLQLSLDFRGTPLPGVRSPCGVLSCAENYATSASNLGQDHVRTNSSPSTITGLRVFTASVTVSGSSDSDRRLLVAALTLQQPNITRVSNGMKVDGHLEASRATLRLEIFKNRDCSAEFTCEVISLDVYGTEVVHSNNLQQLGTQNSDQVRAGVVSSAASSELMMIVQQLALLENRLEDKIRSVEDKIETRVADKLCQLEAKLSTYNDAAKVGSGDNDGVNESLLREQQKALTNALAMSERVERNLNESFDIVERHLNQLHILDMTNLTDPNSSIVAIPKLPSNTKMCPDHQTRSDSTLSQTLREEFRRLELNTCNSSTEVLTYLHDQISETNTMINNNIKPISDLLMPKSCRKGLVSFVVETHFPYPIIRPNKDSDLNVPYLCDEITDGGGWIIIQRRTAGQEEFYRDWATYRKGFGSIAEDFWIGNENLHALTSNGTYELRVELKYNGKSAFAHYDKFSIASEGDNYAITVGDYDGTAGDSLSYHNGVPFSTFDKDNDENPTRNCAQEHIGAWWYKTCHHSNLNGKWGEKTYHGPRWNTFSGSDPVTFSEMKIRSVDIS